MLTPYLLVQTIPFYNLRGCISSPTPHPQGSTAFVIVGDNSIQVQHVVADGSFNVVDYRWIFECVDRKAYEFPSMHHVGYQNENGQFVVSRVVRPTKSDYDLRLSPFASNDLNGVPEPWGHCSTLGRYTVAYRCEIAISRRLSPSVQLRAISPQIQEMLADCKDEYGDDFLEATDAEGLSQVMLKGCPR